MRNVSKLTHVFIYRVIDGVNSTLTEPFTLGGGQRGGGVNGANAFNESKGPNVLAIVLALSFQLFLLFFYASSYPPKFLSTNCNLMKLHKKLFRRSISRSFILFVKYI
jgi:hypothetical protein